VDIQTIAPAPVAAPGPVAPGPADETAAHAVRREERETERQSLPHGGKNAPAAQALWRRCANAIVTSLAGTVAAASRASSTDPLAAYAGL
jgi:hypothetical protein